MPRPLSTVSRVAPDLQVRSFKPDHKCLILTFLVINSAQRRRSKPFRSFCHSSITISESAFDRISSTFNPPTLFPLLSRLVPPPPSPSPFWSQFQLTTVSSYDHLFFQPTRHSRHFVPIHSNRNPLIPFFHFVPFHSGRRKSTGSSKSRPQTVGS
jgi:hypothetical protein